MRFPHPHDLTSRDYEAISDRRSPDEIITTGFDSTYATALWIYRLPNKTIVIPTGEVQNAAGWRFRKHPTAQAILDEYKREILENE